jgi:hypothetical protein
LKALFWLAVASGPAAILLWFLGALSPQFVETVYSRIVYPALMQPWSRLMSSVPIAVAPWLLVVFVLGAGACFVFLPPLRALSLIGAALSLVIAWFILSWGLNYQRQSWAANHDWTVEGGSVAQLEALARKLADRAGTLRPQVNWDSSIWASGRSWRAAAAAYERAGVADPLLAGRWGVPKVFPFPEIPSVLGIGGIFIPFTGEPLVNAGPADWQLPFTAAHEAAHLHGWAREDEANFLAFWVLRNDPDPAVAYSAWSSALLYVASALEGTELGAHAWKTIAASLSPEIRNDWKKSFAYWDRYKGPVRDVAGAVNDAYLKSQGQSDGIRSYGRMVDLLLASRDFW